MNTLVSLARKNEKKLFEVCFMGALLLQQVSPRGCSAERAESQWIMQLSLLGGVAHVLYSGSHLQAQG